jgi:hypothetical protein
MSAQSRLIERTKKSRLAASGVTRRAARPSALRYGLSIVLKCIRGAAKSLLLLRLVARIVSVGLPLSPRVGTVQAKSRRPSVGPAALLFYVRSYAAGDRLPRVVTGHF